MTTIDPRSVTGEDFVVRRRRNDGGHDTHRGRRHSRQGKGAYFDVLEDGTRRRRIGGAAAGRLQFRPRLCGDVTQGVLAAARIAGSPAS